MKSAVVALTVLVALSTVTAYAQTSNRECWAMADKVKTALVAHPDASSDAVAHYQSGFDACRRGAYAFGVSQLETALKELGG